MQKKKAKIHLVQNPDQNDFDEGFNTPEESEVCPVCFGIGMEVVPGKGARPCPARSPFRCRGRANKRPDRKLPNARQNASDPNFEQDEFLLFSFAFLRFTRAEKGKLAGNSLRAFRIITFIHLNSSWRKIYDILTTLTRK